MAIDSFSPKPPHRCNLRQTQLSRRWKIGSKAESHWCAPLSARCCGFARTSAPSTGLRLWCASMEPPWLDHGAPKTPCGPHGITLPGGGRGSKRYKKCSAPAQPQTICQLKLGCRHLAIRLLQPHNLGTLPPVHESAAAFMHFKSHKSTWSFAGELLLENTFF